MGNELLALSVIVAIALLILLGVKIWEVAVEWGKRWEKSNANKRWIVSIKLIAKIVIIICLIGYLLIIALNMRGIQSNQLIRFLFVTEKNKFNWIGITSVLAIISLTFTAWDSRRKLKADLISKSRVKWMETVRVTLAEFWVASDKYIFMLGLYMDGDKGQDGNVRVTDSALTNQLEIAKRQYRQIILFIPDNSSNDIVLTDVKLMWHEISKSHGEYGNQPLEHDKNKYKNDYFPKLIQNALKKESEYFKQEWEKAKRGE